MKIKKENWWFYLLLNVVTFGLFYLVLAKSLNCFNKDAWYMKWQYWVFGSLCLIFPVFLMLMVFVIQMNCAVAAKLNVSGSNIYNAPYSWIICFIVPVFGWTLLIIMYLYVFIFPIIKIAGGRNE